MGEISEKGRRIEIGGGKGARAVVGTQQWIVMSGKVGWRRRGTWVGLAVGEMVMVVVVWPRLVSEGRGRYDVVQVVLYSEWLHVADTLNCTFTGGYSLPRSSPRPVRVKYHLVPHISAQPSPQTPAVRALSSIAS